MLTGGKISGFGTDLFYVGTTNLRSLQKPATISSPGTFDGDSTGKTHTLPPHSSATAPHDKRRAHGLFPTDRYNQHEPCLP